MVSFIRNISKLFGYKSSKSKKIEAPYIIMNDNTPVLKTRAQLIEEGKGAYLPKRIKR